MGVSAQSHECGCGVDTKATVEEVTKTGVKITVDGVSRHIEADTIVPIGMTVNKDLAQKLEGKVPAMFLVGIAPSLASSWRRSHQASLQDRVFEVSETGFMDT